MMDNTSRGKKVSFWVGSAIVILFGCFSIYYVFSNAKYDILPVILETKTHQEPFRKPDTFAEEHSPEASKAELIYDNESAFTFKYSKAKRKGHSFAGVFFPLENLDIDFSKYDEIEIGVKPKLARRIPFNLSVHVKKETHQYIRQFIEVKEGQHIYNLVLADFFTPTSWYDRNKVTQVEIPDQDLAKILALSFESCHLLDVEIEDEYQIDHLVLVKKVKGLYAFIIIISVLLIVGLRAYLFDWFKSKTEVIAVPIQPIEYEKKESIEDQIILFLSQNYTNPNLVLATVAQEFGKSNAEISKMLKEKTTFTFPKYINKIRIEEAKRILKSGEYKTVSEVGYDVGFNSPSNFIRVFKGIEGTSPKKFVEQD